MPKVKNYKPLRKVTAALLTLAAFSFGALAAVSASGFALGLVLGFTADNVSATSGNSANSTINVNVSDGITIRVLDSTATMDLEELAFDFVPTDAGVSTTKNAVVEVATSNETGYKLYVQSDWREDNTSSTGAYADSESMAAHTTSLIHSEATSIPAVADKIPTNLGTSYPYWYYYNDFYSEDKVIPAFGNPDKLAESENPTDGDYTTVPITVGVDTSIVAGTYRNKLIFTAIANEIPTDPWRIFLRLGGYNSYDYESFAEAMNDEKIYAGIFDNETAMEYLVDNEELIDNLKAMGNYSEELVPELLDSNVYTDAEKYGYGLPFYLFNNGSTGLSGNLIEYYFLGYGTSCGRAHSVSLGSTAYVRNQACPNDCSENTGYFANTVNVSPYSRMVVYTSSIAQPIREGVTLVHLGLTDLTMKPANKGRFMAADGNYLYNSTSILTTGKTYHDTTSFTGNYHPAVNIGQCFSSSYTTYNSSVTISQWWFE